MRCVSVYRTVITEGICVLAGIPLTELVAAGRKIIYSITCQVNPGNGKAPWGNHGASVTEGRSHSVNRKNGSLEARKESGPIC